MKIIEQIRNVCNEKWKDVRDYEGLYQVSTYGRVKSLANDKEKILKPVKNTRGYVQVNLYKDEKMKHMLIHRLVAIAFIPNTKNYEQINHKDENKINNHVDNLEWCDAKYNCNYGTGIRRRAATLSKAVLQYDLDENLIKRWTSAHEIQRELGYYHGNICSCCNGKLKQAYKHIWRYEK